ncbi:MAG: hypothetical protein DMG76_15205 [Acidobacteria bacterium]|nr:MAG: hypothetical protein DMG76_15205 [Acidobacteriota bacterium]
MWFLVVCLLFEGILRLFRYGHYTIYRPDPRLLWVPEPGRTVTVVNHLPMTINHQGFRYDVDLTQKRGDQFRVIAFGDSRESVNTSFNNWRGHKAPNYYWTSAGIHFYADHDHSASGVVTAYNQTHG